MKIKRVITVTEEYENGVGVGAAFGCPLCPYVASADSYRTRQPYGLAVHQVLWHMEEAHKDVPLLAVSGGE